MYVQICNHSAMRIQRKETIKPLIDQPDEDSHFDGTEILIAWPWFNKYCLLKALNGVRKSVQLVVVGFACFGSCDGPGKGGTALDGFLY